MRRILLWVCLILQGVFVAAADAQEPLAATVPAELDPELVESIQQAGGQVNRGEDGRIVFMGLDGLQELSVSGTASAEWMESISQLPELRKLKTYHCQITDQALGHLKTVKSLRYLELDVSPVTDEGLNALVGLPRLETLILQNLRVTDEGLKTVARLPALYVHKLGSAPFLIT